ncbi:hypothetical protein LCGC14_2416890, partial [marine sediment metagenome]
RDLVIGGVFGKDVAGDLKGKPKPVLYGVVQNIAPPLVNTSKLIYQVADATLNSVDAVYDRGVALTDGGSYASEADLLNDGLEPDPGEFKYYLVGGYFRIGSSPAGVITADATETWEEEGLFNNTAGAALMDRSLTGGQAVNSSDQVEYTYELTKNPEA